MSNEHTYAVTINEASTGRKHRWTILAVFAILVSIGGGLYLRYLQLAPLQQFYARYFLYASYPGFFGNKFEDARFLEMTDRGRKAWPATGDITLNTQGDGLVLSPAALRRGVTALRLRPYPNLTPAQVNAYLRRWVYNGRSVPGVFAPVLMMLAITGPLLIVGGITADTRYRRELLKGILLRGPQVLTRYAFNQAYGGDGIAFPTKDWPTFREFCGWHIWPKVPPQRRRLPNLHHGMTNAAKHNVRMVLGLQGMGQLQALYGDKMAQVILSQPLTKTFLRTGEPDAADWISRAIGEQEWEQLRETRSRSEGIVSFRQPCVIYGDFSGGLPLGRRTSPLRCCARD